MPLLTSIRIRPRFEGTSCTTMHDPNFPDNLQIRPSTRKSIKLTALRREVAADDVEDNPDQQKEPEEDDEDAEQDIETFGIAGR